MTVRPPAASLGAFASAGARARAKSADAFRTISEVADELDVPQHVLRFWETRFSQIRPLKRAGGRRYYRPEDVALVARINSLLNLEGYTIRGVQKLLSDERKRPAAGQAAPPASDGTPGKADLGTLRAVRDSLVEALADDSSRA